MIRFASLGSGSKGNATLIESGIGDGDTRILLDCGFSTKEVEARLAKQGRCPSTLTAIVVTHEHSDHVIGVGRLSRKHKVPVWLTAGTYQACKDVDFFETHFLDSHSSFEIENIGLDPFPVPHDAREPSQFIFTDGSSRLGVVTDLGSYTPHICHHLNRLDALLLECNYDQAMLLNGSYPKTLKDRVVGKKGHLDNHQASELLKNIDVSKLRHLVGMHVSEKNNKVEYALSALSIGLGCKEDELSIASQKEGFNWREL